jgi:hypothetical protein
MHNILFDSVNKTADFDIHDQAELDLLIKGISELIRKQELKTVTKSSRDIVPKMEYDTLKRYVELKGLVKVGVIRLTAQQMYDLESAINEGIVKYEKEVTDSPEDDMLAEMKSFKRMIHNVLRTDVLKR